MEHRTIPAQTQTLACDLEPQTDEFGPGALSAHPVMESGVVQALPPTCRLRAHVRQTGQHPGRPLR